MTQEQQNWPMWRTIIAAVVLFLIFVGIYRSDMKDFSTKLDRIDVAIGEHVEDHTVHLTQREYDDLRSVMNEIKSELSEIRKDLRSK